MLVTWSAALCPSPSCPTPTHRWGKVAASLPGPRNTYGNSEWVSRGWPQGAVWVHTFVECDGVSEQSADSISTVSCRSTWRLWTLNWSRFVTATMRLFANFWCCIGEHKEQKPCPCLRYQRQVQQGSDRGLAIPMVEALVTMAIMRDFLTTVTGSPQKWLINWF